MKNGKKPKKQQKIAIKRAGLNPDDWYVTKNLTDIKELHIVNRKGQTDVIPQ